jgi:hypothetical protein
MILMKNITLLGIGLIILFAYSCKKSSDNSTGSGNCRMVKSTGSLSISIYFYDESKRFQKMMHVDAPNDTSWEDYYYQNDHVIYMIRIYPGTFGDTIFYTYNNGKYTEVDQYGFKQKYYYDNSNQLKKIEKYSNSNMVSYATFTFSPEGDCLQYLKYVVNGSNSILDETVDMEYGTFRNPYSSLGLPPLNSMGPEVGLYLSKHNLTRMRTHFSDQNTSVLVYTYTSFNDNGYPPSFSIGDSLNHIISVENIEYNCP